METDYLVPFTLGVFTISVIIVLHFVLRHRSRPKRVELQAAKKMDESSEDVIAKLSKMQVVEISEGKDSENSENEVDESTDADTEDSDETDSEESKKNERKMIQNDMQFTAFKNGDQRKTEQYSEENKENLHRIAQRKEAIINEEANLAKKRSLERLNSEIALIQESALLTDQPESLSDIVSRGTGADQVVHIGKNLESTNKHEMVEVDEVFKATSFTVQRNGLDFISPYCEVIFPQDAVRSSIAIEVIPHYNVEVGLAGKILATVVVEFRSADPLIFESNVRVKLRTPYIPLSKGKPVVLEVVKSKNRGEFKTFATVKLENDYFVSFWCKSFCRVAAVMDVPDTSQTEKRYYTAAIAEDPTDSPIKKVYWMVCEDMPNTTALNKHYFDINDRRRVICAQTFYLGPNCELRLQLANKGWLGVPGTESDAPGSSHGISANPQQQPHVEIWPEHAEIGIHGNYKLGFDRKKEFSVAVRKEDDKTRQKLTYRLYALDTLDSIRNRDVMKSTCTLDWSIPTGIANPPTLNAYGPNSTALNRNLSGYGTSGYGSDRHVNPAASSQMVSDTEGSMRNPAAESTSVNSAEASHFRMQDQMPSVAETCVECRGGASQMTVHPTASGEPDDEGIERNISRNRTPSPHCEHDPQVGSSVDPPRVVDVRSGLSTIAQQASDPVTPNQNQTQPKESGSEDVGGSLRASVLQ